MVVTSKAPRNCLRTKHTLKFESLYHMCDLDFIKASLVLFAHVELQPLIYQDHLMVEIKYGSFNEVGLG